MVTRQADTMLRLTVPAARELRKRSHYFSAVSDSRITLSDTLLLLCRHADMNAIIRDLSPETSGQENGTGQETTNGDANQETPEAEQ